MYIANDKSEYATTDFFDMNFNHLDIRMKDPHALLIPEKPRCFDEMKRLATILSQGLPQVRLDFYETTNGIYFGELTFYHWGGMVPFHPTSYDEYLGSFVRLPID